MLARVVIAFVVLVLLAGVGPAAAGPDLVPEIYAPTVVVSNVGIGDVAEGCAGGTAGRTLLRFGLRIRNEGDEDLVIGNPGCPNCPTHPGASCANPLFVCSTAHGHPHFDHFATAELFTADGDFLIQSGKQGFCILDVECDDHQYDCSNQGISAGCADIYGLSTPCQYIDLTEFPLSVGTYRLRVGVDTANQLVEDDDSNNTTEVELHLDCTNTPYGTACEDGDPCTVDDYCGVDGTCVSAATQPTRSRLRVRRAGAAERHRLAISATFDASWLLAPPTEVGAELAIASAAGDPLWSAVVPAGEFRETSRGRYLFRAGPDAMAGSGGLLRLRIKEKSGLGLASMRAVAKGEEVAAIAPDAMLRLSQRYGEGAADGCLLDRALDCRSGSTSTACDDR